MMKRTHITIGLAATIPFIIQQPISILGIIGSVAPDWDIRIGLPHRTVTHSLIALVTSTLLISMFNTEVGNVWFVNYILHLIADSFTKMGVPFLYPKKKRYGLKVWKTGGVEDYIIQIFVMILIISYIIK